MAQPASNAGDMQATHVAATWCETLVLTKDDLIVLFEKNPRAGKRIVKTLLAEVERKEKLQLLLLRFIIGSLPKSAPVRNALIIQKAWSRYAARLAAASQNSARPSCRRRAVATRCTSRVACPLAARRAA